MDMKSVWIVIFLLSQMAWSDEHGSSDDARLPSACHFLVKGDHPVEILIAGDQSAFIKFASALARCTARDRTVFHLFSEDIVFHRCYPSDPLKTVLVVDSNPNQQEVCSSHKMHSSNLPPIKLHKCLDKYGNIVKIAYSAQPEGTVWTRIDGIHVNNCF